MATLAQVDGLEHGLATTAIYNAVAGSPAIVTSPVRTGARALEISAAGAAENVSYTIANTYVASSFYIRFAALPGATVNLAGCFNANGSPTLRYNQPANQFDVVVGAGTAVAGGPTLAVDTWYRVDIEVDTSGGTATMKCRVDGGTEFSANRVQTSANCTTHFLGTNAAQTFTAYYDDWIYSVTATDYPLGAHTVERLMPTADGTHNTVGANELEYTATGTDITNSSTDVNTLIDDAPLDVTPTDYINDVGTSATAYVEVTFGDLASGSDTPMAVKAYAVDRDSTGTGTSAAISRVLLSDSTAVTPDIRTSSDDPGTTVTTRKKILDAPAGGWDRTKVDGLKARLGFGDGAPDVWFSSLMLEVAMQPATVLDMDLSPVTMTLAPQALDPVSGVVELDLSPVTFTLTPQALDPALPPLEVDLSPVTLTLEPQALDPVAGVVNVDLSPVTFTLQPQALDVVAGTVNLDLVPVAMTFSPQALDVVAGTVNLDLVPVTLLLAPQPLDPQEIAAGAENVDLVPVNLLLSPQALDVVAGVVNLDLGPVTLTLAPQALDPVEVPPGTYSFTPPTEAVGPGGTENRLLLMTTYPFGIGLVREGSLYVAKRILHYENHVQGKVEGYDYFRGGYRYTGLSAEVASMLIASGYTPVLE